MLTRLCNYRSKYPISPPLALATIISIHTTQVGVVSQCKEFEDVHLRANEKRVLNALNKDKNRLTIRYLHAYLSARVGRGH